jgi:hypothetical protein
MINKDEMLTLLRSVAVPSDVEEGMGHAFDLGVDWERARIEKILGAFDLGNKIPFETFVNILDDIRGGVQYP